MLKSKFKSEKSNKDKHKSNVVLKENEKNDEHDYVSSKYLFTYFMHTYL